MNEAGLTKKIVARLRKEGAFVAKIHGGVHQASGIPDVIGSFPEPAYIRSHRDPKAKSTYKPVRIGVSFGIEVKMPGKEKTLTPRQKHKLEKMQEAGARVGVATTVAQAICIMRGDDSEELFDWENHGDSS